MKSPTVIISEADVVGNKGAVAMVNCIVNGVQKKFPSAKFIITSKFIKDPFHLEKQNIEILYDGEQAFDIPLLKIWIWWILNKIGINLKSILNDPVIKKYLEADLIVSASGISFNDNFGLIKIYHFSKYLQIPIFLGKKVIKFTQTYGPFESSYNKFIAKLCLNHIHLNMARGRHSLDNLKKISVEKNVKSYPDIALTLEAKYSEKMNDVIKNLSDKIIIGFSPNIVCKRLDTSNEYVNNLKSLCNHIMQKYENAYILFIPHSIEKSNLNIDDDYKICKELSESINKYSRSKIINTLDNSPEEIKWLISNCDFFIGSRFHSLIAAISSNVPSIAIGWHWKYEEMMEWLGVENNVIQYWELTSQKLIDLFENNFNSRKKIKEKLNTIIPELKIKAYSAIDYICEELSEKN